MMQFWFMDLRVWWDFGVENVDVTQYMLNDPERAINRGSFITRTSVHNQPVKHVWGDVDYMCGTALFKWILFS